MLIFIASLAVISLHGTILMPFLSYFARFTWRGRMPATGILAWKWSKVEIPILRNSKRRENQRGFSPQFLKNSGPKKCQRGTRGCPQACTARPPPQAVPWELVGCPLAPLFCYMEGIVQEKSPRWFLRRLELRRIGISNLLHFQARIPTTGILPLHVNLAK